MYKKNSLIISAVFMLVLFTIFLNKGFLSSALTIIYIFVSISINEICKLASKEDILKSKIWVMLQLFLGIIISIYIYKSNNIANFAVSVLATILFASINVHFIIKNR